VSVLAAVPTANQPVPDRAAFERAAAEFVAAQRLNADRPEARSTLGNFYARHGLNSDAQNEYKAALRLSPQYMARPMPKCFIISPSHAYLERERMPRQAATLLLEAGVLPILDVHLVVGVFHKETPEACRRSGSRRSGSGNRLSGNRRSGSRLRRVAMMSCLSPVRRRQSGRSCESEDGKTNKNAFDHSRLLEAAAKGRPSSVPLGAEMWACSGRNAALALIGAYCCATATRCKSIYRSRGGGLRSRENPGTTKLADDIGPSDDHFLSIPWHKPPSKRLSYSSSKAPLTKNLGFELESAAIARTVSLDALNSRS
jgi:hypothetical protein